MPLSKGNQSKSCKATIVLLLALTVTGLKVNGVQEDVSKSWEHFDNVSGGNYPGSVQDHFDNVSEASANDNKSREHFDNVSGANYPNCQ